MHRDRWEDQWAEAGVELKMEDEHSGTQVPLPAAVNASLLAQLSSVRADWPLGVAAGGLTQGGWGHVRWGEWSLYGMCATRPLDVFSPLSPI